MRFRTELFRFKGLRGEEKGDRKCCLHDRLSMSIDFGVDAEAIALYTCMSSAITIVDVTTPLR